MRSFLSLVILVFSIGATAVEPKDVEVSNWKVKMMDNAQFFILFRGTMSINKNSGTLFSEDGKKGSLNNLHYSFLNNGNPLDSKTSILGTYSFDGDNGSFTFKFSPDAQTFEGTSKNSEGPADIWSGTRIN